MIPTYLRHTRKAVLASSLAAAILASAPAMPALAAEAAAPSGTEAASAVAVYLDGSKLQTEIAPRMVDGSVLVPMRSLFEAQGAKLSWDGTTKTVTAEKANTKLIYRIGDSTADLNGQAMQLAVPGRIADGYTLVPLRFVSESLGSKVDWDEAARAVRIYSPIEVNATIQWGVNLRNAPDAASETVGEMLPKGEKIQVMREAGALWLEVRTQDQRTGYISAKPKYSDYSSATLREQQANELIAYGMTYLGTPYEFGASPDQTSTFDCSSFVKRVFSEVLDIELPRVSYDQATQGQEVALSDLQKGDLLFFGARGLEIGHVGIYAGDNQILHTYSVKYGVKLEEFSASWKERFVTARRVY
ncbi:C40 family peptidase [Paenibacillus apis]|uniref:NlpC/P60 domain-containing protein n=1 Tax=Paenibacillus apis TaxID=1792174 RepID=A0A919Y7X5_9BACL|nr:stalk domain-containing protein [Paenibacillus apis]GIO44133.1 hypothetical protein J41TS4_38910 [Paenibacillus apis]